MHLCNKWTKSKKMAFYDECFPIFGTRPTKHFFMRKRRPKKKTHEISPGCPNWFASVSSCDWQLHWTSESLVVRAVETYLFTLENLRERNTYIITKMWFRRSIAAWHNLLQQYVIFTFNFTHPFICECKTFACAILVPTIIYICSKAKRRSNQYK